MSTNQGDIVAWLLSPTRTWTSPAHSLAHGFPQEHPGQMFRAALDCHVDQHDWARIRRSGGV